MKRLSRVRRSLSWRTVRAFVAACGGACFFTLGGVAEPTRDEILLKVSESTGIESIDSYPHGVALVGTADMAGVPATFVHVFDAAGRHGRSLRGALTIESGSDGTRAWLRDIGGERRVLGLGEEVASRIESMILTNAWVREGSALGFDGAHSSAGATVLAFDIAGAGTRGSVSIDQATWRPTRWTFSDGTTEQTILLSGEVSLGEMRFPARVEQRSSNGAAVTIQITEARAATEDEGALLSPDLGLPEDTTFDRAIPSALEVRRAPTGHLLVRPTVNGRDVGWFIFDTGAGANVLASIAKEALGLETFGDIPALGVGGTTRTTFVRPETMTLGPATFADPLMIVLDLGFLTPHMGVEVGGIVGYSVLARTVSELDLVNATISIHDPATYSREGRAWTDLIVRDRVPCVRASFEGHEGWFRLDTGANSSVTMHAPAVERLRLLDGRETTETKLGGVGGFVPARSGVLEWFELGGTRIEGVRADFATASTGAFADSRTLGNIGTRLIGPFVIVLDYPHSRIAFLARE